MCCPAKFAKFFRADFLQNASGDCLKNLTYFMSWFHFYTSWKCQKTKGLLNVMVLTQKQLFTDVHRRILQYSQENTLATVFFKEHLLWLLFNIFTLSCLNYSVLIKCNKKPHRNMRTYWYFKLFAKYLKLFSFCF